MVPFAASSSPLTGTPLSSRPSSTDPLKGNPESRANGSLSVNYLPTKFSSSLLVPPGGPRRRRHAKGGPKRGGGVGAFKEGEARMPSAAEEDYDGVDLSHVRELGQRKMKWNKFKWTLLAANTLLTIYALASLIGLLLTWFAILPSSSIILVGNRTELVLSTVFSAVALLTSLIGYAGILLNNRSFLAVYTFMLWIVFALLVAPGYITYKRRQLNLDGKINLQWSRMLPPSSRLVVQNHLGCCGYYSPFVEATTSQMCYSRSVLPGCKLQYLHFQRKALGLWYTFSFSIVPVHLLVIVAGLLCSNHVTYRFGKGMMPKAYRLSSGSVGVIMASYATQLADQYGADVASDVMSRSRSNLKLGMKDMPIASSSAVAGSRPNYDTVGGPRAPPSPDGIDHTRRD